MSLFVGRFHPLLVHLPIGILLIAVLFEWLSKKERFSMLRPAVRFALLGGAIAAVLSCISGYLLSLQDNYQEEILQQHLVSGIVTAVLSIALYLLWGKSAIWATRLFNGGCVLLALTISFTGHQGGSLTHGSTYLTDALPGPLKAWVKGGDEKEHLIANVQDVKVYDEVIRPILEEKCVACHGVSKQKGELRLDSPEFIRKGGKKGKTLVIEKPFDSEIIKRLYLPLKHEQHMPPAGKTQITIAEVQLLQWWIAQGAAFDKHVAELHQPEDIRPILDGLQSADPYLTFFAGKGLPDQAAPDVQAAVLDTLRNHNITVSKASWQSQYLLVSLLSRPDANDVVVKELQPLRSNILELKMGNTKITRESMKWAAGCSHLRRLSIENTRIGDDGLLELKSASELEWLNVVGTDVTVEGILALSGLKKLKQIYCYRTRLTDEQMGRLRAAFPGVVIDGGGYQVPTTADDTTRVMVKK